MRWRSSSSTTTTAAENVWAGCRDGDELLARVKALPGFGNAKARIFVGLLGKRLGVQPPGWEHVAADWPSIADVDTFERVAEIREQKREMKAKAKPRRRASRRLVARPPVRGTATDRSRATAS